MRKFLCIALFLATTTASQATNCNAPNSIISYRTYMAGRFEYVVFTFKNPSTPDFTTTAASPPFSDTSDRVIPVRGAKFTKIVFRGVNWMCSVQRLGTIPKPVIKDVKLVDQFEGQLEFVVGRTATSHYYSTKAMNVGPYTYVKIKFSR